MQKFLSHRKSVPVPCSLNAVNSIRRPKPRLRTLRQYPRCFRKSASSHGSMSKPAAVPIPEPSAAKSSLWLGLESRRDSLQRYLTSVQRAMTKDRSIRIQVPFLGTTKAISTNLSNLCGHGSFVMLALGYLGSDVLFLRLFSAGGITLSVLFQYYRPQPLWIPIGWNTLFLLINGGMIFVLLTEREQAQHLESAEEQQIFDNRFANLGLNPVQFLHLIKMAKQETIQRGDSFAFFGKPMDKIYLIISGGAIVYDGDGDEVGILSSNQFVGSMAFLRFMNGDSKRVSKKLPHEEALNEVYASMASIFDPEEWEIEPDGGFVSINSKRDASAPISTAIVENSAHLCHSTTTVTASSDCRVFSWNFEELKSYLKHHPLELNAMQASIIADLTEKLDQSRDPHLRYSQLLKTSISGDEILFSEKNKLKSYRNAHGISDEEHEKLLSEHGWSLYDYEIGYQMAAVTSQFEKYETMLKEELSSGVLNQAGRSRLRDFRKASNIDPQRHLLALAKIGWTYEQYELGKRENVPTFPTSDSVLEKKEKPNLSFKLIQRMSAIRDSIALSKAGPQT